MPVEKQNLVSLWVHAGGLNVRELPDPKSKVVGTLTRGQNVAALMSTHFAHTFAPGLIPLASPYCAKEAKKLCVSQWWYIPAMKGWSAGTVGTKKYLQSVKPSPEQMSPKGPNSLPPKTVIVDDTIPVAPFIAGGIILLGIVAFWLMRKR
jgi:hypothetical protein